MTFSIRAVLAVWRRHFHVYRKTALLSFLPPMTEPLFYLLAFGYGMTPLVGNLVYQGVQVDYLRFLAGGMVSVGVLFQSFFEGAYNNFVRLTYQRTWHAMLTTPITFEDIFLGELLWAATKGVIAGVLTSALAIVWGVMGWAEFFKILPVILLGSIIFGALGLASSGWAKRIEYLNIPVFLILIPMFSFCGTYFPRTTLPQFLQLLAELLPLSPLVDLMRYPIHQPPALLMTTILLLVWGLIFVLFAWSAIWRRIYR